MPHYAELDANSVVSKIISVNPGLGAEDETVGISILQSLHGENTIWKKCSTLGDDIDSRGLCNLGLVYNQEHDKFVVPQPHSSWTLNSDGEWVSPVEEPTRTEEQIELGYINRWDEESSSWTLHTPSIVTVTAQPSDATVSVGSSASFDTGASITKGEFLITLEKESGEVWENVDAEIEGNLIHTGILTTTESSGNYRVSYTPLEFEGVLGSAAYSNTVVLTINE